MKKLTTVSLFIFWAVVVAIITAGLVFYQKNNSGNNSLGNLNLINGTAGELTLNLAEVAKHNLPSDCWLIINNKIYNVASFLAAHPGGAGAIVPYCGQEATKAFNTKGMGSRSHSQNAVALLADYYIGDLNQKINQTQIQQNIQQTNLVNPGTGGRELEDD